MAWVIVSYARGMFENLQLAFEVWPQSEPLRGARGTAGPVLRRDGGSELLHRAAPGTAGLQFDENPGEGDYPGLLAMSRPPPAPVAGAFAPGTTMTLSKPSV